MQARRGRQAGRGRRLALTAATLAGSALLLAATLAARQDAPDLGGAKTALEQWVEVRRTISQEQRDWELGREMLTSRVEVVQREIEALRAKITGTESSIAEADRKTDELMQEHDKLKEASTALDGMIAVLEVRTKGLLPRLPGPLRERVRPLSQRIPERTDETKLSLSERFQNVVGILNEVDKFNREITVGSEVLALPDGTSVEVATMYVGISQGYYVGANGQVAGVGAASADGWVWQPRNDVGPRVADAMAILKNEKVASFVQLPVHVE